MIGLFPIAVDLGETAAPAHLLLDGRPVCEVTERAPGCLVDLGADPRVHLLELLRSDVAGRVTERVARWVNRPGIEPEVIVGGSCDEKTLVCEFAVTWAHPHKLDPKKLVLQLDGAKRWDVVAHRVAFPIAKGLRPQVVSCDVEFPDGTRATYTRALFAFNPEEAQASLSAIPVVPETGVDAAAALRGAGLSVRTAEETEPEVAFVTAPSAFDQMVELSPGPNGGLRRRGPAEASDAFQKVRIVSPDESLSAEDIPLRRLGLISVGLPRSRFSRYADAVAVAGYELGASPRVRAVVLVLSGFDRPNISSFTPAQAQAYLGEVMVPLVVWRLGNVEAPEWPDGPHLDGRASVLAALAGLRASIGRQRMVWLEGSLDTRYLGRWLAPGIALAGRTASVPAMRRDPTEATPTARLRSDGPDGGPVHAVAASADGKLAYAGTHAGVFRSRDGGGRWEPASTGLPLAPVRGLAIDPADPARVFAATDGGLFRSADAGDSWQRRGGAPALLPMESIAFDPGNPRVVYAGSAGRGVLRSDDGGETLLSTALDRGDVRAVAADPRAHAIFAASDAGVFRSADRGLTWEPAAKLPERVLALAWDAAGGRLFAATAGAGLWSSADAGASWKPSALKSAYLTSLSVGGSGRILAGSPDGIFTSENGGAPWRIARVAPIEGLAAGAAIFLAGSSRGVLRRPGPGSGWEDSSAGLSASVAYAVASSPGGPARDLYAATSTGLVRSSQTGWKPVPGVPDGVLVHALAFASRPEPALYVGTAGSIGRRGAGADEWSFLPTKAIFGFAFGRSNREMAMAASREGALRSSDGGISWTPSVSGMEGTFALEIEPDPADPGTFYAATAGMGVLRTENAGKNWKSGGQELKHRIVRSVAVDPADPRFVYAGTDSGVFRSGDRAETWSSASEGLPQAPVYALVVDPRAPGTLFAGTSAGLFRSGDGAATWQPFPAGGAAVAVTALSLDEADETLVVGSLGSGVARIPLGR